MNNIIDKIGKYKLIPVVTIKESKYSIPLGKAILAGGLPIAEITFRTKAAAQTIEILTSEFSDILVGAGTVLSIDQAKKAINSGAKFIVAPGFNPRIIDYCIENNVLITPGISNPTLIEMALEKNLKIVKFFPAEAMGGIKYLKAIASPYSNIKFIPTGGINQDNLKNYLDYNKVYACGGSWIVKESLISENKFDEITRLTKDACNIIKTYENK